MVFRSLVRFVLKPQNPKCGAGNGHTWGLHRADEETRKKKKDTSDGAGMERMGCSR